MRTRPKYLRQVTPVISTKAAAHVAQHQRGENAQIHVEIALTIRPALRRRLRVRRHRDPLQKHVRRLTEPQNVPKWRFARFLSVPVCSRLVGQPARAAGVSGSQDVRSHTRCRYMAMVPRPSRRPSRICPARRRLATSLSAGPRHQPVARGRRDKSKRSRLKTDPPTQRREQTARDRATLIEHSSRSAGGRAGDNTWERGRSNGMSAGGFARPSGFLTSFTSAQTSKGRRPLGRRPSLITGSVRRRLLS